MTDEHRPDPADRWPTNSWEPYEPAPTDGYRDPLAGLDPAFPPYPNAYRPSGGRPINPYVQNPYAPNAYPLNPYLTNPDLNFRPRTNSMANAAMICALVAIPGMFFCFVGAVLAPAAMIMGAVGLGQIRQRGGETGEGQAWTGIILGGVLTLMCVALGVLWFALMLGA
jgi:hypothetical protein